MLGYICTGLNLIYRLELLKYQLLVNRLMPCTVANTLYINWCVAIAVQAQSVFVRVHLLPCHSQLIITHMTCHMTGFPLDNVLR